MYFLRNFTSSFWFVFRRSLLCFLVFRCSIFKVRSYFRSSRQPGYYITYFSLCQPFFRFFFKSFFLGLTLSGSSLLRSSIILPHQSAFVKCFFHYFYLNFKKHANYIIFEKKSVFFKQINIFKSQHKEML